jgi:murein DD-endopeptidase MepM/ murein hydrolase activator NlpD
MRSLITALVLAGTITGGNALTLLAVSGANTPESRSSLSGPAPFGWPLAEPHEVTRPFSAPAPYGPGHRGVDLAGDPGQPVLAAGPGLVLYAGRMVDRDVVSIEHPGGLRTTYEPVTAVVAVGDQVARGQPIGHLAHGHPGCTAPVPRACLHWGARRRLTYLDPLRLLGQGRVRLLPSATGPPP